MINIEVFTMNHLPVVPTFNQVELFPLEELNTPTMNTYIVGMLNQLSFSDTVELSKIDRFAMWADLLCRYVCNCKIELVLATSPQEAADICYRKNFNNFLRRAITHSLHPDFRELKQFDYNLVRKIFRALVFVEENDLINPVLEEGVIPFERAYSVLKYRVNEKLGVTYEDVIYAY